MLNRRTSAVTAFLAAAVLVLGGCDSDGGGGSGPDAGPEAAAEPSVIAPGKPGETAATMSAKDAARQRSEDDSPNTADFTYTQMMIVHHGQALEMTGLAPGRAESKRVERLASRIAAAQRPEIGAMKGWLKKHGGPREHAGHDHATMPGMASAAQLKQLRAAKGGAFDELFLKLMITHHSGAVTMATDVLSEGNNIQVEEMANDVVAQQSSEIGRMREMG
ncbi:DUF305 domain-containing protein [Streptomyces sp. NPDC020607]|uniref:DUF305 domain-containing protein n=1 Tax=Streptomyces sp. NPDC020607 TaxID=3365082 RepID=UPI0037972B4F